MSTNKVHLLCVNHGESDETYVQMRNVLYFRHHDILFSKYKSKIVLTNGEVVKCRSSLKDLIKSIKGE